MEWTVLINVIYWVICVIGGFAILATIMGGIKRNLISNNEYDHKKFCWSCRILGIVFPLVYSYIFLQQMGYHNAAFELSMIVVGAHSSCVLFYPEMLMPYSYAIDAVIGKIIKWVKKMIKIREK